MLRDCASVYSQAWVDGFALLCSVAAMTHVRSPFKANRKSGAVGEGGQQLGVLWAWDI